jgi:hypothetical protein
VSFKCHTAWHGRGTRLCRQLMSWRCGCQKELSVQCSWPACPAPWREAQSVAVLSARLTGRGHCVVGSTVRSGPNAVSSWPPPVAPRGPWSSPGCATRWPLGTLFAWVPSHSPGHSMFLSGLLGLLQLWDLLHSGPRWGGGAGEMHEGQGPCGPCHSCLRGQAGGIPTESGLLGHALIYYVPGPVLAWRLWRQTQACTLIRVSELSNQETTGLWTVPGTPATLSLDLVPGCVLPWMGLLVAMLLNQKVSFCHLR